jgi:alanine racemase
MGTNKEDELTYGEVVEAQGLTKQQKYDLSSVINSLEKLEFFEGISEDGVWQLKNNIRILEKMGRVGI